jgi:hypothetical protein
MTKAAPALTSSAREIDVLNRALLAAKRTGSSLDPRDRAAYLQQTERIRVLKMREQFVDQSGKCTPISETS